MNEQRLRPCRESSSGLIAIEQVTRIHAVSGGAGAACHLCQHRREFAILFHSLQNAEGFAPKLGGFGAVLGFGVITRRGLCLRYMKHTAQLRKLNPEVMVE